MIHAIQVERDLEGLRKAAMEVFMESLSNNSTAAPIRQLAEGYYAHVEYLLWLKSRQRVAEVNLTAEDVDGICAVEAAHDEFTEKYPRCGACGHRVSKFLMSMHKCKGKN